jgi:predicted GIY-YIG superfamily endonuclease
VHIVRNSEGRMYIGLSEDVAKRVADHNSGVSTWTEHRGPRELIWQIAQH